MLTSLSPSQPASDVTVELAAKLIDEDSELVSIYFGEEVSEEDAQAVADAIADANPDVDVEVNYGGQPIYSYFISVE